MMPPLSFPDYAAHLRATTDELLTQGLALIVDLAVDQRSALRGLVRGVIVFEDGSQLHVREFVDMGRHKPKLKYAYHYQDSQKQLIFRYDNAAHRPPLGQPEHKHIADDIVLTSEPSLQEIVEEVLNLLR